MKRRVLPVGRDGDRENTEPAGPAVAERDDEYATRRTRSTKVALITVKRGKHTPPLNPSWETCMLNPPRETLT